MSEIPRVPIPADMYDAALGFCNRRRKKAGLDPWCSLPAGGTMASNCPCAQSVPGLHVGETLYYDTESLWFTSRGGHRHRIGQFIRRFDALVAAARQGGDVQGALPVRTEAP